MNARRPSEKKLPGALLRHERGQSLVEFSISMMVVLMLLSGVLDIGRAFYGYLALRDAAQEGASYGSIAPLDSAGIRTRVRELSSNPIDLGSFADD
ncbi:MAG: pilus assembly protein, partial [Anaerolineae bacterium]|nr:pilus assembly protein [Anaerolineae bacterium]NIN98379.1 pilus assembly protein [Anaerolineae bacterium]